MGHVVNKNRDPVSTQTIHRTQDERKKDFKEFKERKDRQAKIKDERFVEFEDRRKGKGGGGKGINIDTLKD